MQQKAAMHLPTLNLSIHTERNLSLPSPGTSFTSHYCLSRLFVLQLQVRCPWRRIQTHSVGGWDLIMPFSPPSPPKKYPPPPACLDHTQPGWILGYNTSECFSQTPFQLSQRDSAGFELYNRDLYRLTLSPWHGIGIVESSHFLFQPDCCCLIYSMELIVLKEPSVVSLV